MNINNLLINEEMPIREAIQKIDAIGKKIILVTNGNKLTGVITDGDIRRWILQNGSLAQSVDFIMNKNPKFLTVNNKDLAGQYMKQYSIEAIPIVNINMEVVDIVFWDEVFIDNSSNTSINSSFVVIMAGGMGTRLKPYTQIVPKMLIPIGDIPIIERIIDRFLQYNFSNFYITINYKKDIIKAYFSKELNYNINFIEEESPLGTAGGLHYLKDEITDTFFVSNCDILIDANYSQILKYHKKNNNKITVITALKNYPIPYGVFNLNNEGNIISLDEKPTYEFLVNTGMYVLEPEIFDIIKENEVCNMTDIIQYYISIEEKVGMYPITDGAWLDMGEFESMKAMFEKLNIS